ncbi:Zinc finger, C3HC-like [Phaffia rhodozyma]|uniref:Zinc finger, C3HC-like n=1 Tax=Phaffia rhodozyma TaxID=264483 RepID=A0A0F7SII1_PHARH|nr:Zinc finger, C3HC-like [Phaffia rhodozyma]
MAISQDTSDTELELQLQLDIEDVFSALFPEDVVVDEPEPAEESSQLDTSNITDKPFRSELTFSKQELKRAVDALVASDDQTPSTRGAKRSKFLSSIDLEEQSSLTSFLPFSLAAYTARLSTYTLLSFSSPAFTPQDASIFGWINKGRNRLVCASCQAAWVVSSFKGLGDKPASRLKERMRRELLEAHTKPCPWRTSQTDPTSFGNVTGHMMTDELVRRANEIDKLVDLQHVELVHPLNSHQIASLLPNTSSSSSSLRPSTPATLLSFFNWIPISTSTPTATSLSRSTRSEKLLVSCSSCRRRLAISLEASSFTQPLSRSQSSSHELHSTHEPSSAEIGIRRRSGGVDIRTEHAKGCPFGTDDWVDRLVLINGGSNEDEKGIIDSQSIKSKLDAMLGPKMTTADRRAWQAEVSKLSTSTKAFTSNSSSSAPLLPPIVSNPPVTAAMTTTTTTTT